MNILTSLGIENITLTSDSDPISNAISKYNNHPSILKIRQHAGCYTSFSFSHVSADTVHQEMFRLMKSTATPILSIPPSIIKEHCDIFAKKIHIDFNASIKDGIFPNNVKYGDVSSMFKTSDTLLKSNYRPISNLQYLSDYIVTKLKNILSDYIVTKLKNILSDYIVTKLKNILSDYIVTKLKNILSDYIVTKLKNILSDYIVTKLKNILSDYIVTKLKNILSLSCLYFNVDYAKILVHKIAFYCLLKNGKNVWTKKVRVVFFLQIYQKHLIA